MANSQALKAITSMSSSLSIKANTQGMRFLYYSHHIFWETFSAKFFILDFYKFKDYNGEVKNWKKFAFIDKSEHL